MVTAVDMEEAIGVEVGMEDTGEVEVEAIGEEVTDGKTPKHPIDEH